MAQVGAHTLTDVRRAGRSHVCISCGQCDREGRYGVAGLLEVHGNIALPDLLALLTKDCEKRLAGRPFGRCDAVYIDHGITTGS